MKLPDWFFTEKILFIDIDEIYEGYHLLAAKREDGVRYSLGLIARRELDND